jgi:superfamily II DNA/RNA helicase
LARWGAEVAGRVLVFTGQPTIDERDRIKRAFNAPFDQEAVRILVCTDAAREGINLQARCRDLIHFDLPWNPSRLEQRNGRIDRKLQPAEEVTCRYFSYAQREEDRVLDALVAKTERIRRELGAAGQVIRDDIEARLRQGIARGSADALAAEIEDASSARAETAEREMTEADAARLAAAKRPKLQRLRDLHDAMDRAVLRAYGWDDLARAAAPVFLAKPADEDSKNARPGAPEQEHTYQGRLHWPSEFRDEVLRRLLALNAERHREEQGLARAAQ